MARKPLPRVRFSITCPGMFGIYVDTLLRRGLYGNTRAEVVRNLLGGALMSALDGDTIRALVEKHKGKLRYRT